MKYSVRYVHKISQTCSCKHVEGSHYSYVADAKAPNGLRWTRGKCTVRDCNCASYEPDIEHHELPDGVPGDRAAVTKILRECGLLNGGQKLSEVHRNNAGQVVCILANSTWHSIILTRSKGA